MPWLRRSIRWVTVCLIALASQHAKAAGTWLALSNLAPDNIDTMLLLSDGTVMGARGQPVGTAWYRLTPDSHGSYASGTWSALAPMHDTRLYFSSQVLRDGRVFVAGAEYGSGTNSAEVYDPLSNAWTMCPGVAQTAFSDSISMILPNGNVLVAPVFPHSPGGTVIYNPVSNTWSNGPAARNGNQNEASWVKLPDDSILTIDPFGQNSERYIPALNQWIADAPVPVKIYDNIAFEIGAGLLLPNGKAFYIGGTGHSAIYTPSGSTNAGSWIAGPDLPNGQSTPDAPAAMMVNGKILWAVSPIPTTGNTFPTPTSFYEYDYISNVFTRVGAPGGGLTFSVPPYQQRMLDLPDGTVLFSWSDRQLYNYRPDGSPAITGKPVINSITRNGDGSFHLIGTGLNGISAGAAYGDDAQVDSNYPLVRLSDTNGQIFYGRTFNWSSTGVMTGTNLVTTEFKVPTGLPLGTYDLVVVANGISSDAVALSLDPLQITPGNGFNAAGFTGGPFIPNTQIFTLTNSGTSNLNWILANVPVWLSASLTNGTLTPGGPAANVIVSLNSVATNFSAGTYNATIWFTNLNDGVGQSAQFSLQIQAAPLVKNGGFETGNFSQWTLVDGGAGFDFVDNGSFFPAAKPHSGTYDALFGQPGTPGSLSQNISTAAGAAYLLSLWLNNPDGSTPNEFFVTWNGNKLFDQTNVPASGWTNLQFLVKATNSLSMLQFGFRDDSSYLALDDISITLVPAPLFQATTVMNGIVNLTWSAVVDRVYQVQYTTNLATANWVNLGGPITAGGITAATNDVIGIGTQRFYRVALVK